MIDQIREWVKSGNYYHENGDHDSAERVLSYALEVFLGFHFLGF